MEDFYKKIVELSKPKPKVDKYVLLENDSCSACRFVKETLQHEQEQGNLEFEAIDVLSEKGQTIAKMLKVEAIPKLFKANGLRLVEEAIEFENDDNDTDNTSE